MDALTQLSIQQHCTDLVARYALAVNHRDVDGFVNLFTADAVWQRPNTGALTGHAQIRAFIASQLEIEGLIRHVNGAVLIDVIDERTAAGWSQTVVYRHNGPCTLPVLGTVPEMVVEYRDHFRLQQNSWLFDRRDTTVVFVETPADSFFQL